jgi:hypothetical protein
MDAEPLADHAALGQAAERDPRDAEHIQERHGVTT